MGMMDDGCTSLAWKAENFSVAGQNWDVSTQFETVHTINTDTNFHQWEEAQKDRLVLTHIIPKPEGDASRPKVSLVTEAGLLCKSGLNSSGVSVFVNAIKARGVKFDALPIHIALRTVLDCHSRLKAIARLRSLTFGTSGHILIADKTGGTSLEFSHLDICQLEMENGQIAHTNHFLVDHAHGVVDACVFPDSLSRMKRTKVLLGDSVKQILEGMCPVESFELMLEDEDGFPTAINRKSSPIRRSETLYSFVADLDSNAARLRFGRPNECEGLWTLKPCEL